MNLYVSLSALHMLQYVPIVTYPCKLLFSKKKQKKKKDPYFGMGKKMPKLCHNTPLSIFSLGKGRESLCLKTLHKKLSKRALSALFPACKHSNSDNVWMMHTKISQNKSTFPQMLHLSSNRRVCNLAFYFQFTTPARKLTHRMKFEHVWMQKDMNFRNTIILCYLGPENHQIQPRKTQISHKTALIDPSKNAKESIHFSRISHIV